jgi:hypothetical protein
MAFLLTQRNQFFVDKGKLLGNIILKYDILIDPSRNEAIKKIPLPKDKKALQSFFREINFIRRFIPNFAKIVKPLNRFLKNIPVSNGMMRERRLSNISKWQ